MALLFDGSNDYILTSRPFTDLDNWTLAAWVNYPGLSRTFKMDVYNGEDGNPGQYNGYGFGLGGDNGGSGSKLIGLYGGVAWKNTTYTFSSADTWYHVVMVRTSGTLKFYVNGADVGYSNTDSPQTVGNTNGVFSVGAQDRNSEGSGPDGMGWYANTRMAEVAAWQRALSTGEIAALGKGFAPSFFKLSLLRYLPLTSSTHVKDFARGAAVTTGDAPATYAHPGIYLPSSYGYVYTTIAAPADISISVNDSATITDSLPAYSQTEQATITESVGLLITSELNIAVSDSTTITEAVTADVSDPQVSATENSSITESVAVSIIDASALAISVSDNASITESVSATVSDPQVNASDSSTITESVNVALQTGDIQISVSDSATITDSLPAYSQVEQATITESVGLSIETPAAPDDLNVSVSDTITVTDFVDYTDDFNRADSTDIGANWWVGDSGNLSADPNMQIVSNQLTCIAEIYSNDAIYLEPISQADSYTQVTWISSFTGDARIALYARSDSNAQNTYLASFRSTTGDVLFYNHLNGAVNLLYDGTTTHTYEAGDVLKITVINNESNNPVLRAYVNDTLMGEYEDASANKINTSGYAGIRMSTGTETVDDFEAGPGLPGIQITTSDPQVIVSDSSTITESVTVNIEATPTPTPSVSDSITITEDVTVSIGALATPSPNVSDSATITESVTVSIQETNTATPAATDTATITESVTVDVSDPQIAVSESATITESVSVSVGGRYSKNDRLGLDIGSGLSIPLGPQRMATWGTNARPANAVNGMIGYNTELQQVELYQEGAWYKLEATPL